MLTQSSQGEDPASKGLLALVTEVSRITGSTLPNVVPASGSTDPSPTMKCRSRLPSPGTVRTCHLSDAPFGTSGLSLRHYRRVHYNSNFTPQTLGTSYGVHPGERDPLCADKLGF